MFLPSTSGAASRRPASRRARPGLLGTYRGGRLLPWVALLIVGLFLIPSAGAATHPGSLVGAVDLSPVSGTGAPSMASSTHAVSARNGAVSTPAANPPCLNLNATICISVVNGSVPNIVPAPGNHVANVEPSATSTIGLYVKSQYSLVWPTAKASGPLSPLSLNATGVLWNGDRFYNASDGTTWHPTGTAWWTFGPTGTNKSYPYWYGMNFSAKSPTGLDNFYPGMTLTWWVYIQSNLSGIYSHSSTPPTKFQFTFSGAWPYSPDPGASQYAGPGAALEDLSVTQRPFVPNFNDTVNISVATTSADVIPGASLGGAYADVVEYATDGAVLDRSSFNFPVSVSGSVGSFASNIVLPTTLSQNPGALVQYSITAWDTNTFGPDEIVTQMYNYTVNGNGSFASGAFADDLAVVTTPLGPGLGGSPPPQVPAGASVQLLLTSRNSGTSIFAAEVAYTFEYAPINESVTGSISLARFNSTNFGASLPPMPLGAEVQFQVLAWDFSQDRDVSSTFTYVTPTLASLIPAIPTNSTFFLVYVYDNGTRTWVTGASVAVSGAAGFVRSYATTFDGVAYPNATYRAFVPLLLPAGEPYKVTVLDPSFMPNGGGSSQPVVVTFSAPHDLTQQGVLEVGTNYLVAEAGNALYFWLNESGSGATYSAPVGANGLALLSATVGLAAVALTVVPLLMWWSRIRARRLAQEKRITL